MRANKRYQNYAWIWPIQFVKIPQFCRICLNSHKLYLPLKSMTEVFFYDDPELEERDEMEDAARAEFNYTVYSFPLNRFGAIATSFSADLYQNSLDSIKPLNDFRGTYCVEMLSPLSVDTTAQQPIDISTIQTCVDTPQVALFWQRYREYPKYLKNVKKRNRRKNKRKTKSINDLTKL